jgi:glycosyltransferase involved in cell wall biosynthesis
MANISVVVLTHNERVHIERCIRSARQFAQEVFVVDSGSDDGTVEIARSLGAAVYQHAWENHHARQLNWALTHLPIPTEWVFRLDADEWVSSELAEELNTRLQTLPADVTGVVLPRRQYAFGRFLRWGGHPVHLLRVFRRGQARCEERWMDEHLVLTSGRACTFQHDFVDENLKPLHWWTTKQANYAVREAADTFLARAGRADQQHDDVPEDRSSRRKRLLKIHVYRRIPRFIRPVPYFFYRYVLQLGALDGVPGLMWHVLQGFWYRFLVDSIISDIERRANADRVTPLEIIERVYGLKLDPDITVEATQPASQP